ncbi:polyprenyl synthetase family protein [Gammaproteobacteria bacterium]|nr:polyprenyl synthetase family protein [Gammaproteobacteria bacterium]
MLHPFLSQIRDQVFENIQKSIGDSNNVEKSMSYSALSNSKMIRAGLIFASGRINKNISQNSLLTLASSVELIHTYSLIHDDLPCMDNDDFRRGKASNHIKFGEANAILSGDALQTLAYEIICDDVDLSPASKIDAIKLISKACGKNGMVFGQHLDIKSESKNLDEKSIENIHILKTSKLIECSVMLAQISNSDERINACLESFGKKIGLAFQITDDILEVTSDKETLGKNTDSDLKNFKSTYINVIGMDASINKTSELTESAIYDLKQLEINETDLLIELAKYMTQREI